MSKLLGLGFPDQLRGSAPKLLGSGAISLSEMRNSILDSGPEHAPKKVEIRILKAALESASGPAEASIQVAFKGSLVVHVVLLPVKVLSLVGLLPSSLITLGLIIAWGGNARTRRIPGWAQKALTGLV